MDKKYNDVHILFGKDEYVIREVTNVCLRNARGFVEITYNTPMYLKLEPTVRIVVPCVTGLSVHID